MNRIALGFLIAMAWSGSQAAPADDLAAVRAAAAAAEAALARGDLAAAETAYDTALAGGPQRQSVTYALASIAAKRGETDKALSLLSRIGAMGGVRDLDAEAAFAPLRANPAYGAIVARMARNALPRCACETVFTGPAAPVIAEGIVVDGARLLVAEVHARRIVAVASGASSVFVAALPDGLSPFGMTLDRARGRVWVAAASLLQSEGATQAQRGRSALLAFDLRDGHLLETYPASGKQAFGDVALGADGAVYVSDGLDGSLFWLPPGAAALARLVPAGTLASAQGMAVSADGRRLLVADYTMGLLRIDLRDRAVIAIAVPPAVTTLGIDGLVRLGDGGFAATQNGIAPPRIVRFALSPDWSRLESLTVLAANAPAVSDPSLLATDGTQLYINGVSQWSAFDDEKPEPARPVPAFQVVRLTL